MDSTAKGAVSWSVPTPDPTGVRRQVVDPIGHRLSQVLVREVMGTDPHRITLRTPLAAGVLVGPNDFLLFAVHTDHAITGPRKRLALFVDVPELAVPVGMLLALQGFGVALPS